MLGISASGLMFAVNHLRLHFRKQAVAMPVGRWDDPQRGIPEKLGDWVSVSRDKPLDPDTEHVLGTDNYLYRCYVNQRLLGEPSVKALIGMSPQDRAGQLDRIQQDQPEAVISLGLTYYTGMVDTVAHIPDRCYIGDGYDVSTYTIEKDRRLGKYANGTDRVITFRYINFDDQTSRGRMSRNVAYLFHVDGHYEDGPLGVRRSLQNLLERYGYYAKVELMTASPPLSGSSQAIQQKSLAAMEDFLSVLLPQVERCLPDWQALHARPQPSGKPAAPAGGVTN